MEPMLIGVIVEEHELGALEALKEDTSFLLPLEEFCTIVGIPYRFMESKVEFVTPLGEVTIPLHEISQLYGVFYVSVEHFSALFAIDIEFDQSAFALRVDLPWNLHEGEPLIRIRNLRPDVFPPALGISTIRQEADLTRVNDTNSYFSRTLVTGPILGGLYRFDYRDDMEGKHAINEYAWRSIHGSSLALMGYQNVHIHALLPDIRMTGMQTAWTNQPLDLFPRSEDARELLPRRTQPVDTFRGNGPPGGQAELFIEGRSIDAQIIGLNGIYEFLDVVLPARLVGDIEVFVYDRHNPDVPLAIHAHTPKTNQYLLAPGAVIQMIGAGYEGNYLQDHIDDTADSTVLTGFYFTRIGVRDNVTAEGAIQRTGGEEQIFCGTVYGFGKASALSLGGALFRGKGGISANCEILASALSIRGRGYYTEQGYRERSKTEHEIFADLSYDLNRRFFIGVLGRDVETESDINSFILPYFAWNPLAPFSVRTRPAYDGEYRIDLAYRPFRRTRITVSHQKTTILDITQLLGKGFRFSWRTAFQDNEKTRTRVLAGRSAGGWTGFSWAAGFGMNEDTDNLLFSTTLRLAPAMVSRLELEIDDPFRTQSWKSGDSWRIQAGVSADFSIIGRSFLPVQAHMIRTNRGGIAGKVRLVSGLDKMPYSLKDLYIFINGQPFTRTIRGGTFFAGNLEEGTYLVELDTENLPLELSPVRHSAVAQVVNGAITHVEFGVRPEFGIAGRIQDETGRRIVGIEVELVSMDGSLINSARTDRFGLYRMDGIIPGTYRLRVRWNEMTLSEIERQINVNDFLFDQDLCVSGCITPGMDDRNISE